MEILDEIILSKPSIFSHIGLTGIFNWRSLFDFSSEAWETFPCESRIAIIDALAEKRTLFVAVVTYKTMYNEMDRPDIASATGLSLAKCFEEKYNPSCISSYDKYDYSVNETCF